jgi:spectinomycin phosphotransferase
VFPVVERTQPVYGAWPDAGERCRAAELIGVLHSTPPPASIRLWDAEIPGRSTLFDSLQDRWTSGPYGEGARQLLVSCRHGLKALFDYYDALVLEVRASGDPMVVTHGEPHSGNFISAPDGKLLLVDWDTVRLAPRERDLETMVGDDSQALLAYQRTAGAVTPRAAAMELFRARWALDDISSFIDRLRGVHGESADDLKSWNGLNHHLPVEKNWPAL